jgi:hypothetical protein
MMFIDFSMIFGTFNYFLEIYFGKQFRKQYGPKLLWPIDRDVRCIVAGVGQLMGHVAC